MLKPAKAAKARQPKSAAKFSQAANIPAATAQPKKDHVVIPFATAKERQIIDQLPAAAQATLSEMPKHSQQYFFEYFDRNPKAAVQFLGQTAAMQQSETKPMRPLEQQEARTLSATHKAQSVAQGPTLRWGGGIFSTAFAHIPASSPHYKMK